MSRLSKGKRKYLRELVGLLALQERCEHRTLSPEPTRDAYRCEDCGESISGIELLAGKRHYWIQVGQGAHA